MVKNLLSLLLYIPIPFFAQQADFSYKTLEGKAVLQAVYAPHETGEDWQATLQHMELPKPGTQRSHLLQLKEMQAKRFPLKNEIDNKRIFTADMPVLGKNMEGNAYNNSVPNDNDVAVSNDGFLVSVKNTNIWAYNLKADTLVFQKTLANFTAPLQLGGTQYDPKVVYDPENNRFIVVILRGYTYQSSWIIVGFSSSSNPADPWKFYKLKGNPINNNTWSDYPVIGINSNELFIGINTFYNGSQNNSGFKESCLWQVDKAGGYAGDSTIQTRYYYDILAAQNDSIFNITPMRGGSMSYGPNMYCLSNKNLRLESDTIYLLEITGKVSDAKTKLKLRAVRSSKTYFLPVTARQANGHTFDTNDSRILGGFYEDGRIQFVQSTTDTSNGRAAIYHGFIYNLDTEPVCDANIISDNGLDYGYPNIAYTGVNRCDNQAIISFNHTDSTVFSGCSAIFFSDDYQYSPRLTIKAGLNYVNVLSGVYERWGDYSGVQRKYNENGKVYMSGSFGKQNLTNGTWIAELISPYVPSSKSKLITADVKPVTTYAACDGSISNAMSQVGFSPYVYTWSHTSETGNSAKNLCSGTYIVTATDKYTCAVSDTFFVDEGSPVSSVFPNPAADEFSVFFEMPETGDLQIDIYDRTGKLVKRVYEGTARKGRNLFTFSTHYLSAGAYIIKVNSGNENLIKQKLIKQ